MRVDVGPTALLRINDARVAVSSVEGPMNEHLFRMAGIQPEKMRIPVNKGSMLFRANFGPIGERLLVIRAPGAMAADPADLPWKRPGARRRVRAVARSNSDEATSIFSVQTHD